MSKRGGVRNMTTGSPLRHILLFSLPLLAGNFLQQFYNMVDSWVVGNYVSDAALAAVGVGFPVLFLFSSLFSGIATGGTVVIDHGCGVKSYLYGLETVGVERGQSVSAGDPLGTAGTAHNLIYELRIGSKSTDPQTALDGNSGLQFREAE